jgi:hypothetical protein
VRGMALSSICVPRCASVLAPNKTRPLRPSVKSMLSHKFERLVVLTKPWSVFLVFLRDLETFQPIEIYFAALTINSKRLNIRCGIVMNYELKLVRVSYHLVLFHGVSTPAGSLFNRRTRYLYAPVSCGSTANTLWAEHSAAVQT